MLITELWDQGGLTKVGCSPVRKNPMVNLIALTGVIQEWNTFDCTLGDELEIAYRYITLSDVSDNQQSFRTLDIAKYQESGILYFQQQQQAYISCYNWYHNMATTHSRMSIKYNYKKIDLSIVSSCE